MITGFSKKKIKTVETLGDRLKEARLVKEISLSDAEAGTKVRAKYLVALEEGNWNVLPQSVYARSFVTAYARFLGVDIKEAVTQFDKESAILIKEASGDLSYHRSLKESRVLVTPRILAYGALSVTVMFMLSYIVYQVAGFAGSPDLKITSPADNVVTEQEQLDLAGVTDNDSMVTVNGEEVPVTSAGNFSLSMRLHRGVNVINVTAVNRAKKESSQVYTVEYRPKTAEANISPSF